VLGTSYDADTVWSMTDLTSTSAGPSLLAALVRHATADALFSLAGGATISDLEAIAKRRGETYVAVLKGQHVSNVLDNFDAFFVEMSRALAPVHPPMALPMADVIAEGVTLELGARGLRGLFRSTPSDKDVQHVKRVGGFAARSLRAVLSADGDLDEEERRSLAAFVGALGLSETDAAPLLAEAVTPVAQLEVYGELEPGLVRALMRSAWLAAAWDAIDPREEDVVRALAGKLGVAGPELEQYRTEALARVDARRALGVAAVDAVRFVLSDRVPGFGVQLAVAVGTLTLPRRHRDEALAHVGHWTKVQLSGRHRDISAEEKARVLAMSWLGAMFEDPTLSRRAILRARHDRIAADLGEDAKKVRGPLEQWLTDVLAPAAFPMTGDGA
jgi:hypothetical protein